MKLNIGKFIGKGAAWAVARFQGTKAGHAAGREVEDAISPVVRAALDRARPSLLSMVADAAATGKAQTATLGDVRGQIVARAKKLATSYGVPPPVADLLIKRLDDIALAPILAELKGDYDAAIDRLAAQARAIVEAL